VNASVLAAAGGENRAALALIQANATDVMRSACALLPWVHFHCLNQNESFAGVTRVDFTVSNWRHAFGETPLPGEFQLQRKGWGEGDRLDWKMSHPVYPNCITPWAAPCWDFPACLTDQSLPEQQ
jgi:hypothetical protein